MCDDVSALQLIKQWQTLQGLLDVNLNEEGFRRLGDITLEFANWLIGWIIQRSKPEKVLVFGQFFKEPIVIQGYPFEFN